MKTTKSILVTLMSILSVSVVYAQPQKQEDPLKEFKQPPLSAEKVIGIVTGERNGGRDDTDQLYYNEESLLEILMEKAKNSCGKDYPKFSLRDFKWEKNKTYCYMKDDIIPIYRYKYDFSAKVVVIDPKEAAKENLSMVIEKALRNTPKGSRVSIDQIKVITGINEDDYKDFLIEILLDKGYKVVAKEFMQRLYEEQKQQQTGVYNEETTVLENNFSAVGYYINIRMTEEGLRMQVVNVSTGEYEGNAIINY